MISMDRVGSSPLGGAESGRPQESNSQVGTPGKAAPRFGNELEEVVAGIEGALGEEIGGRCLFFGLY